ncbi:MAG: hypothetical protein ACU0CA_06070 [Paracoccaceae bacterium]
MEGVGGSSFNIVRTIIVFTYMVLISVILGVLAIFMPVAHQVNMWMEGDQVPPRDFFWLTADKSCQKTDWQDIGWQGKDTCRLDIFNVSDISEINQIANIILDFNIAAVTAVFLLMAWRLTFYLMNT